MPNKAIEIVRDHINDCLDESMPRPDFEVFIVWQCKTLQNWKFLLASNLPDQRYYELTYDGDKDQWYLDDYVKLSNQVVKA